MSLDRTPYEACPLCNAKEFHESKTASCLGHALYDPRLPSIMRWLECNDCRHVYVDGYFEGAALDCLLSKTQESQTPGYNFEHGRYAAADIVDRVIAMAPGRFGPTGFARRWLDVGFGAGHLVTTADEYGFETVGVDARQSSVDALCSLGYDARNCELSAFEKESFDVVSMADVLEHVPYPGAILGEVKRILKPGGALFVSMPNSDCLTWRALDALDANPYWGELEHLHNFSRERLYQLLAHYELYPHSYGVSRRYRACLELVAST